jgi:hypothetical protein
MPKFSFVVSPIQQKEIKSWRRRRERLRSGAKLVFIRGDNLKA